MKNYEEFYPESKSWKVWMNDLKTRAENTRRQYPRIFIKFLERWNLGPEELFELKLKNMQSEDPRDRREVEGWVRISMKEAVDIGYAPATARMIAKAVNNFFQAQNLDFKLRAQDKPRVYHNGSRLILKDQLKELYDRVGEEHRRRNRAIVLSLKDSGLRVSDLRNLKVGQYLKAKRVEQDGEIFAVLGPIPTIKTGAPAYPHFGPESVGAIDVYLEERKAEGEVNTEDPLFVNRYGKILAASSMSTLIWKLADKLDESSKISAHSLRKFFQTSMEMAGLPKNWIGKYMGKVVGDSTGVYSQPEEVEGLLTGRYIEAYPSLRIFGETSSKQLKEQASEIDKLRQENERLQRELKETTFSMRQEFEDFKRMIFEELKRT